MFQQYNSKTPISAYRSFWHTFTMVFIGYLWVIYIPTHIFIWRLHRSSVAVVAQYSSARPMYEQGVVIKSKTRPSDSDLETEFASSFPSLFLSLSPSSYTLLWFVIVPYFSLQQSPNMDSKITAVSLR